MSALLLAGGVAAVGFVLALAVLVTALQPLETVILTVEDDVSASFWTGLVVQALAAPALAVGSLALTLTVIGVLLVPLLALAWVLALAGAITLGVVAVACVVGRSRLCGEQARSRQGLLRAVAIGSAALWLPWFVAAALVSIPGLGLTARLLALALTWGAMTVGLGAVVRSRGARQVPRRRIEPAIAPALGSRPRPTWSGRRPGAATGEATERPGAGRPPAARPAPDWQTPTPVTGVVAARRPAPADPTALDADR